MENTESRSTETPTAAQHALKVRIRKIIGDHYLNMWGMSPVTPDCCSCHSFLSVGKLLTTDKGRFEAYADHLADVLSVIATTEEV